MTGQSVAIQGRIDLELLPRPTLTLARATLSGDSGDAGPTARSRSTASISGSSRCRCCGAGSRSTRSGWCGPCCRSPSPRMPAASPSPLAGGGIVLPLAADGPRRLSVVDGRAVLDGAGAGPGYEIEAINLDLVAAGADGPLRARAANSRSPASRSTFTAQLGQLAPEAWSTLQLEVTATRRRGPGSPELSRARLVRPGGAAAARRSGAQRQRCPRRACSPSTARSASGCRRCRTGSRRSFRLAGHLEFADQTAQLDELQLALGEAEAQGELQLALGAAADDRPPSSTCRA